LAKDALAASLYTILPLPILYGMNCNKKGSGGDTNILRNSVGDMGGSGVPNQRESLLRILLIRVQKPCNKRISCQGQAGGEPFRFFFCV